MKRTFNHRDITSFDNIPMLIYHTCSPYTVDCHLNSIDTWVTGDGGDLGLRKKQIELCPDYQRGRVWTEDQRIAFVEYVLRGGRENTTVIFNQLGDLHNLEHPYECLDGLQRLTALHDFKHDRLKVFGKLTCSQMSAASKHGFPWSRYRVTIHVLSLQTRAEILRFYLEMNSAGTPHSAEELERVTKLLRAAERKGSK